MARRKNKRNKQTTAASPSSSPSQSSSPLSSRFNLTTAPTAALALCALIAIAFFPATGADFIWDDTVLILPAEPLQRWSGLWQIWFEPTALSKEGHYWPALYTTYWLEHRIWGFNALGAHLVNLVLHAAVTVLLWRLLLRLNIPGAFVAAAVFAVHPVHVEPVVWVIGRKDLLAALFFLSAAFFYIRFVEQRRSRRDYAFAVVLFALGMFSKTTVVTLPAALLLWHWWRHARVTAADGARILPLIVVGVALTVADWSYYTGREIIALDYSLVERLQIAAHALWFYAGKLFLPTGLAVIYPHFTVGAGDVVAWLYVAAAVALAAVLWFARHRVGRGPLAGALFFAVVLSPVSGVIDYGYMQFAFTADRYQYLAAAGIIVVVVAAAAQLIHRLPATARTVTVTVAALAVLLPLSALTWQQTGIYQNAGAFFGHILAHNPAARGAHDNYGIWLRDQGRFDEALAAFAAADPDSHSVANNIGLTFAEMKRYDEAERHYRRALQLKPNDATVLSNLARASLRQKNYTDAERRYEQAIDADPNYAKAHADLGVVLIYLGRHDDALQSFDRALALNPYIKDVRANREKLLQNRARVDEYRDALQRNPRDTATMFNLAALFAGERRIGEAIEMYRAIVEVEPDNVDAHLAMAKGAEDLQRWDEAAAHYQNAARAAANDVGVVERLADFYLRQKNYPQALSVFQTLTELAPTEAKFYSGRGIALAELQRLDDALASFDRALKLNPDDDGARANRERLLKLMQN